MNDLSKHAARMSSFKLNMWVTEALNRAALAPVERAVPLSPEEEAAMSEEFQRVIDAWNGLSELRSATAVDGSANSAGKEPT